ncbi:hypothetical protein HSX37_13305|uniref:Uncharacterized protein n=1 Tax=Dendrosporobacter quercicolus TaxID=146817 RepID=A0A1H0AU10_9FIRM|nr:hypothetical protein [Dendrosporobacter quercicolus]NSL49011.1 hypothetical protein [Dendrosporobacter quercicolus DSM 1736]SDN36968.1 hypothetical protein SAMN04488502_1237 [Dendrosporobacter quercicolus]
MDKNKHIQPVGSVASIVRAKPLGSVKLFKRPEYLPNQKRRKSPEEQKDHEASGERQLVSRAVAGTDSVGARVDVKA